jgi:hypothetical protein
MSSRSLAAARARRAGDPIPPVSGNRPITSIGSQAAFAQQLPSNMNYNMPPPPNNVRTAKGLQQPPQMNKQVPQQYQQFYDQQQQQPNSLPFQKLSISDAIGLITLRLGRVEQWIIETDHEEESKTASSTDFSGLPDNHKIIDNSVLTSIVNRLNSLEKNTTGTSSEENVKLSEDIVTLNEQFKRMSDDVSKHTIELSKNTEQVFRFNRELTETKDILKSFMVKYDMFAQEITQNFNDYENAIADLEKRVINHSEEQLEEQEEQVEEYQLEDMDITTQTKDDDDANDNDNEDNDIIVSSDLKKMIKQEFANNTK